MQLVGSPGFKPRQADFLAHEEGSVKEAVSEWSLRDEHSFKRMERRKENIQSWREEKQK